MNQMQCLVHHIPFFAGKDCTFHIDIYHNDNYPACLLVHDRTAMYKVRFPGVLNENSVQNEHGALKLLSECDVAGIPQIADVGIVDGVPYLIEHYIEGSSLDKIHHILSLEDWEHIAHRLALFLQKLMTIRSAQSYVFKRPEKLFYNYGIVIKDSILRHLSKHTSSGLISPTTAERIRETIEDIGLAFHMEATFLHFDIKPQNIIFDPQSKQVAFIDYEHSRIGDYTHEIFRIDMAVARNPYFRECWELAKKEFLEGHSDPFCRAEDYSRKLFYYKILYNISEMTYSAWIGDKVQTSAYRNGLEDILQQL